MVGRRVGKQRMGDTTSQTGLWLDRATRFAIPMSLRYRRPGEKGWRRGKVENVSRTGILFSARLLMDPGTPVEIIFQLPVEAAGPGAAKIRCRGDVVRTVLPPSASPTLSLAANIRSYKLIPGLPV
jgi:hypothetical protein